MIEESLFYPTLTAPYKSWPDKRLVSDTHYIHTCTAGSEYFTPLATQIANFGELSDFFRDKVAIAGNRDKNAIIAKDLARQALIGAVMNLSNSVSNLANGDVQVLTSSGMPMRKRPQSVVMTVPTNMVITNGNVAGQCIASVDRIKGAMSYVVKYTLDPQTPDSIWASMYSTSRQCVINGLQSGAKYWIMIGAVGGKGQILWSTAQLSPYIQ